MLEEKGKMVCKFGKFGVNNGRTVRSRSSRSKRSEGLLIHTTAFPEGSQDKTEVTTYSLGKQNRWLLPEVIKTTTSAEFEKDEVVLVERFTNDGKDRPDCLSVYSSKDNKTRKSKGRLARAKDLLVDVEYASTRFEVSYPSPLRPWQKEKHRKRSGVRFETRKKNSRFDWSQEEDFEEVHEEDLSLHCIEEDLSEHCHSNSFVRSITMDFDSLLRTSPKKKSNLIEKSSREIKNTIKSTRLFSPKEQCIYVDSGDDMYNAHQELLTQIREMSAYNNGCRFPNSYNAIMNDWGYDVNMVDWGNEANIDDWGHDANVDDWGHDANMDDWGHDANVDDWGHDAHMDDRSPVANIDDRDAVANMDDRDPVPNMDDWGHDANTDDWGLDANIDDQGWNYDWRAPVRGGMHRGRGRGRRRGGGRGRGNWRHGRRGGFRRFNQVDPNLSLELNNPSSIGNSHGSQHQVPSTVMTPRSDLPGKCLEPSSTDVIHLYIALVLSPEQTNPAHLEEMWGEKYLEAESVPRAFALKVTPLTSQDIDGEVFVLFRQGHRLTNWFASVTCSEEHTHKSVLTEFISEIRLKSVRKDVCGLTLEDIVNTARNCFCLNTNSKADTAEPRLPKLSFDVFADLLGWKSKAFTLAKARQEIKMSLGKEKFLSENPEPLFSTEMECGICFMELSCNDTDVSSTTLTTCGHTFCNNCWRTHLKTQIDLGQINLRCPGHECSTTVDDVTLMLLAPSLYGRHMAKRVDTILEICPKWKWCPADQCKLVVKATIAKDSSKVCSSEHSGSVQPLPVACLCGNTWCFKCQEDAHWPATCEEAQVFRKKHERYAKMVENSKKEALITSVGVKNCPFCNYPIQKGLGCNHMVCGLCGKEFCWYCLQIWSSHGDVCKGVVALREVVIPVNTKHLRSYEHHAVMCHLARSPVQIQQTYKKLDNLKKRQQFYESCSYRFDSKKPWPSSTKRRMRDLCDSDMSQDLPQVFGFKFQALLVLEGLAMVLSFKRDSPNKRVALEFERLLFIVERLNDLLQDFEKGLKLETLERMKNLVACGKKCLCVLYRNTKSA